MLFNFSPRRTLEFRPPSSTRKPAAPVEQTPARDAKRIPARSGFYTAVDEFKGLEDLGRVELDEEDGDAA